MSNNIQEKIFYFMRKANRFYKLDNNFERKAYVIQHIKESLGDETFEVYKEFIDDSLEFLVRLSKNRRILKEINNTKSKCLGIF